MICMSRIYVWLECDIYVKNINACLEDKIRYSLLLKICNYFYIVYYMYIL